LWDTAGQERFQSLGVGFYRGADAAVLVYDITDPASLDHLNHWRNEFLEHVGGPSGLGSAGVPFPFVVMGNKVDKEKDRRVPYQRADEWCRQPPRQMTTPTPPLQHFETSAKTAVNVDEAFQEVARLALQYEDYKKRSQPQLFVPPEQLPVDLRRGDSTLSYTGQREGNCC
jgi:Ras-related protein Rab-7A